MEQTAPKLPQDMQETAGDDAADKKKALVLGKTKVVVVLLRKRSPR